MINISDLSVQFHNGTKALNNLNLDIGKGIFGLLGENGAGKTTFMRVLTTIIKQTDGAIIIDGIELNEKNYATIKKNIGYLPQELGLYPSLTVRESLEYMGLLAGIEKSECKKRIDFYLEKTNMVEQQNKKNRQLSGGMKRRVGLIQAILHEPAILIVDEPTTGLDPEERIRIRNLLVDFSNDRTVLLSTHVIEDLSAVCNSLAILNKGNLIYNGTIANLLSRANGHVWSCSVNSEDEICNLQQHFLVSSKQYETGGLTIKIISDKKPDIPCQSISSTLEDAYIDIMNI